MNVIYLGTNRKYLYSKENKGTESKRKKKITEKYDDKEREFEGGKRSKQLRKSNNFRNLFFQEERYSSLVIYSHACALSHPLIYFPCSTLRK